MGSHFPCSKMCRTWRICVAYAMTIFRRDSADGEDGFSEEGGEWGRLNWECMFVRSGVWKSEDVDGRWEGVLSDCS
jgi:hypothetical protein